MKFKISWLLSPLALIYVLSSLTLSGIPGWSRLSVVSALLLLLTCALLIVIRRIVLERWAVYPITFVFLCVVFSLTGDHFPYLTLSGLIVCWLGAVAVAMVTPQFVRPESLLYVIVLSSVLNSAAVAYGFDAYIRYSADFRFVYEAALLKRPSGLVGNPNLLAVQAILPLFLLWRFRERSIKLLWILAIPCACYAMIMSGSRKGLLLAIVFSAMVLHTWRAPGRKKAGALLMLLGGGGLVGAVFYQQSGDAFELNLLAMDRLVSGLSGTDTSFEGRKELIRIAWELIVASPLWGYGLDSFRYISGTGLYSHNNVTELLVSGGLVLAFAYYAMHAVTIRAALVRSGRSLRLETLWFFLALGMLELSMVTYESKVIAIILLLWLRCVALKSEKKQ